MGGSCWFRRSSFYKWCYNWSGILLQYKRWWSICSGGLVISFSYTWETNISGLPAGFPLGDSASGTVIANGASYNGLFPGNYWVVAHYSDSASSGQIYSGCDVAEPFTINSPLKIQTISTVPLDVSCYGDVNGEIDLQINGGVGPYTVLWDTTSSLPNGSIDPIINNLQPGTYTVNIYDAIGCSITEDFVIGEPDVLTNNFTISQPPCAGLNGTLSAFTQGGTPGYSYTPPIAGGHSGTKIFTITDANGCTLEDIAIFIDPDPIIASVESDNLFFGPYDVSCNGESDGSATVVGGGGTNIISYSWSPSGGNGATANNLSAGSYTVTVSDNIGCNEQASIIITEPDVLVASVSQSGDFLPYDISCYDYSDGWAQSNPIGGVPATSGYVYDWVSAGSSISNNYYVENGGWHFTNIRTPMELEKKLLKFAHHFEYEQSGLNIEDLRKMMKERKVVYDHSVDQKGYKWSGSFQLKKVKMNLLPAYIYKNEGKYTDWLD